MGWLRRELAAWEADGLIDGGAAAGIAARYEAGRRVALERVALLLGGVFVGVGLLWGLVANYDGMTPWSRFIAFGAIWLAAVVAAEALAIRVAGPLSEVARVIAVSSLGGVVFQGADVLDLPENEVALFGVWAGAALAYAYATRSRAALVVAGGLGAGWYAWWVAEETEGYGAVACALLVAAVLATSFALLHEGWMAKFAPVWRPVGVLLALAGLYLVAFPDEEFRFGPRLWEGVACAVVVSAVAAWRGPFRDEVAVVVGVLGAGLLLAVWVPRDPEAPVRAVAGIAVYVLTAAWFAFVGTSRGLPALVPLAGVALTLFVTTQSFEVFSPMLPGAVLFLVLGAVFIGTGVAASQGRRLLKRTA